MKRSFFSRLGKPFLLAALGVASLTLLALGASAGAASAETAPPGPFPTLAGEPAISADETMGYYIWRDDNGFHLRTHGPGDQHIFTARIHTDGIFRDVDAVRLENKDNFAVIDGGHTIVMRFHTYDFTDGINFKVRGGTYLRFNLQLDSELIPTDHIFLGAGGKHPANNPFTLRR